MLHQTQFRPFLAVTHAGEEGDDSVGGGLEERGEASEPTLGGQPLITDDGVEPRAFVQSSGGRKDEPGLVVDADLRRRCRDQCAVPFDLLLGATECVGQGQKIEIPAVAGERTVVADVAIEQSSQVFDEGGVVVEDRASDRGVGCLPLFGGGEDVVGEVIDEPRSR